MIARVLVNKTKYKTQVLLDHMSTVTLVKIITFQPLVNFSQSPTFAESDTFFKTFWESHFYFAKGTKAGCYVKLWDPKFQLIMDFWTPLSDTIVNVSQSFLSWNIFSLFSFSFRRKPKYGMTLMKQRKLLDT